MIGIIVLPSYCEPLNREYERGYPPRLTKLGLGKEDDLGDFMERVDRE